MANWTNQNQVVEQNNVDPNLIQQDQGQQDTQPTELGTAVTFQRASDDQTDLTWSDLTPATPAGQTPFQQEQAPTPTELGDAFQTQIEPVTQPQPTPTPEPQPQPTEEVVPTETPPTPLDEEELMSQIVSWLEAAGRRGQKLDEGALRAVLQQQLDTILPWLQNSMR